LDERKKKQYKIGRKQENRFRLTFRNLLNKKVACLVLFVLWLIGWLVVCLFGCFVCCCWFRNEQKLALKNS